MALNQRDNRDPEDLLARLASLSRDAGRRGRFQRHELYHRASTAVRVGRIGPDGETSERIGDEEGTAVRLRLAGETGFRFAATTGSGQASIDQSIRLALGASGPVASRAEVRGSVAEPLLDHDVDTALPSPDELRRWLDEGLAVFRDSRRSGEATEPEEAWFEVA